MILKITLDIKTGSYIDDIIKDAIMIAKTYDCKVYFTFSNVKLFVTPNSKAKFIYRMYKHLSIL